MVRGDGGTGVGANSGRQGNNIVRPLWQVGDGGPTHNDEQGVRPTGAFCFGGHPSVLRPRLSGEEDARNERSGGGASGAGASRLRSTATCSSDGHPLGLRPRLSRGEECVVSLVAAEEYVSGAPRGHDGGGRLLVFLNSPLTAPC